MTSDLVVCGTCFRVRGNVEFGRQPCRCEPRDEERWKGFDFNQAFELCYCCGAELLRSGSRWSVWFCAPCKERVAALNRSAGLCVIPIGRHSVHAGIGLAGKDARNRAAIEVFVDRARGFFELVGAVADCNGAAVRANLDDLGLLSVGDVPLDAYLEAVGHLTIDHDLRVQQLLECMERH